MNDQTKIRLPRNVWILTVSQALILSVSSMVVFVGGLVGAQLAPLENLATLPVASIVVGTAVTIPPVTFLMNKIGRRRSFFIIGLYSVLAAILASYAISISNFYLFCFSTFLFGATYSCVMQFRFASMESVSEELIPKAASMVLVGGIAAAFLGPEIAVFGKDLLKVEFAGSFILLAGLFVIAMFFLTGFKNPIPQETSNESTQRPLKEIFKQRVFWVSILSATIGYAVMSFIMTATPVSMHVMDGHSLSHTKWVIQSHIVAMFLPSLITAWIIKKLGLSKMMITGLVAYLICIAIAFAGKDLGNYWVSLILLGVGWNFLFIGATTLLPQCYNPCERFKVQAVNDFVIFGTQAVASLSAGWFIFAVGWKILLLINLPFILFLSVVILKWKTKKV
ncbi:MFS transporter [Maribellus maritimus]|uniref:MFS transporter n=1 Tax=Maribellus maritimus TaxID=2870838 RepID=UPI001EEACEF2|nr:MFS transporter [Maribellus maritimus]MCG6188724.1 MFS transporter [Maribellus maritimus]